MKQGKILLVDDNATLLGKMQELLELHDFEVVPAGSVNEALNRIASQQFDVLITDLHMPDPGDGFTVVTAMRHAQPDVLTLVVSGFPDVQGAMAAILLQAGSTLMWRDSRSPHTSANRLIDSMARFSSFAGISCTLT
jgi:DNA-binding NtrC family response regulator